MAIDLEEIMLFGLLIRNQKTIQIREEHFQEIQSIVQDLVLTPVDYQKLYKLGFIRKAN